MNNENARIAPTHYEVLGLPRDAAIHISRDAVKQAYRRALLRHHPDKDKGAKVPNKDRIALYSVDQILAAYETLSEPTSRAAYVNELKAAERHFSADAKTADSGAHSGVENVDLDEMMYNELTDEWAKDCRCGLKRGYIVREEQLEKAAEDGDGEVYIGCEGCSLCIRVLFHVDS